MSGGAAVPFAVEPKRGVKLRGKATREGTNWYLALDLYPEKVFSGFDLVKARAAVERWAAARIAEKERRP